MTATSSTVLVVEIQALGQLLAEKDAKIEQLKVQVEALSVPAGQLGRARQRIAELEYLLTRAAEALAYQAKFINDHCCDGYPECGKLIAQLRKAV